MNFADTLLATLIGALVGALVGAVAAWGFALDLRRREGEGAYADRLDEKVSRIVEMLGLLAAEANKARLYSFRSAGDAPPATERNLRGEALAVLRATKLAARTEDANVLDSAFTAVSGVAGERGSYVAIYLEYIANQLVGWRRGEVPTETAARNIQQRPSQATAPPPQVPE